MRLAAPLALALLLAPLAEAGVQVGATRLIHDAARREISLRVRSDAADGPVLVQSWVEDAADARAPYVVTPPLVRLDGGRELALRIVPVASFAKDRESVFWLNVKVVPPVDPEAGEHVLHIAVNSRIKLFHRPAGLAGSSDEAAAGLRWRLAAGRLIASNSAPYHVTLSALSLGKQTLEPRMLAPLAETAWELAEPGAAGCQPLRWRAVNDYGGESEPFSAAAGC